MHRAVLPMSLVSQEADGLLIGGGPRAFQKYESGDRLPGRAISCALALKQKTRYF